MLTSHCALPRGIKPGSLVKANGSPCPPVFTPVHRAQALAEQGHSFSECFSGPCAMSGYLPTAPSSLLHYPNKAPTFFWDCCPRARDLPHEGFLMLPTRWAHCMAWLTQSCVPTEQDTLSWYKAASEISTKQTISKQKLSISISAAGKWTGISEHSNHII